MQHNSNNSTNQRIIVSYPGTERKYISGRCCPDVNVAVRQVNLAPSVINENGECKEIPNTPIYIYDTTGAYGDEALEIDFRKGIPEIRKPWVKDRKKGETQMYFAKKGIITPEMEYVAIRESMNSSMLGVETITPEFVRSEIAAGRAIIPANVNHTQVEPMIIGRKFSVKTSTNIIVDNYSRMESYDDIVPVIKTCKWGFSEVNVINRRVDITYDRMLRNVPIPMGCTPIIDAYSRLEGDIDNLSWEYFKDVLIEQTETGIDLINIHCDKGKMRHSNYSRNLSVGGTIMNEWCKKHAHDNFIYEHFDEICDICASSDTMIQLSSTYRHSSIYDSNNAKDKEEKELMHELVQLANSKNVQIMVEGLGYSSIDKIKENIETHMQYCPDTPFNVSVPSVVDNAVPYMGTSRTIGSSIAGYLGASLLCYDMLQREILNEDEICRREAVAFNISAISANVAKGHMDTVLKNNASYKAAKDSRIDDVCKLSVDSEETKRFLDIRLKKPLIIGKTIIL